MARKRPTCGFCKQPIAWFRSPFTGDIRKFEPRPVDGRAHTGTPAYPVEGRRAWRFIDLVEDLRVRRETTQEAAEDEAYDMPWYVPHDCPKNPYRTETQEPTQP